MVYVPKKEVIYKSLSQVFKALNHYKDVPEVRSIVKLCYDLGLHQKGQRKVDLSRSLHSNAPVQSGQTSHNPTRRKYPFVVIEGLDGTGKTTLTHFLSTRLQMKLMSTPPKNYEAFIKARDFFDGQEESFRRAYYSLGNYLAAYDVIRSSQPVVMDRFWHSTAAYAIAHEQKLGKPFKESDLVWPSDLLLPDLVIFLQVSENERLRRHSTRKDFTNTPEEQTLAEDQIFRQNLGQYYRSVVGPPMKELVVDNTQKESERKILSVVLKAFPELQENIKEKEQCS